MDPGYCWQDTHGAWYAPSHWEPQNYVVHTTTQMTPAMYMAASCAYPPYSTVSSCPTTASYQITAPYPTFANVETGKNGHAKHNKEQHNEAERTRRERINNMYAALRETQGMKPTVSKEAVLDHTCARLQTLERLVREYCEEVQEYKEQMRSHDTSVDALRRAIGCMDENNEATIAHAARILTAIRTDINTRALAQKI
jgi:hypothetical protein